MLELLGYWVGYLGCWIAWLLVAKLPLCLVAKLLGPAAPHARSRGGGICAHLRTTFYPQMDADEAQMEKTCHPEAAAPRRGKARRRTPRELASRSTTTRPGDHVGGPSPCFAPPGRRRAQDDSARGASFRYSVRCRFLRVLVSGSISLRELRNAESSVHLH